MKHKLPAILITLLLLTAAVLLIVWQSKSKVASGEEVWAEVAICPRGIQDKTVVPEGFSELLESLKSALASAAIGERVAGQFERIMPKRVCLQQVASVQLEPLRGFSNRVRLRMATDNPLVGTSVLYEVLQRVEREFLASTSRLGTEQEDLIRLQNQQIAFQTRILNTQQELGTLVASSTQSEPAKLKIDSLRSELSKLEEMDRLMSEQLKELHSMGEGMTFQSPTLEWRITQPPTFERVSDIQLKDYAALQADNRGLLGPLTPAMQNALAGGTGFTVE